MATENNKKRKTKKPTVIVLEKTSPLIFVVPTFAFILLFIYSLHNSEGSLFFIYMMLGVKSLLQFSVAGVMVLVQMWISFLFIGSGSDSVMTSTSLLSLSLFGILTVLHFFLAKLSLKALHQHEFVR